MNECLEAVSRLHAGSLEAARRMLQTEPRLWLWESEAAAVRRPRLAVSLQ